MGQSVQWDYDLLNGRKRCIYIYVILKRYRLDVQGSCIIIIVIISTIKFYMDRSKDKHLIIYG